MCGHEKEDVVMCDGDDEGTDGDYNGGVDNIGEEDDDDDDNGNGNDKNDNSNVVLL